MIVGETAAIAQRLRAAMPDWERIEPVREVDFYGALNAVARYCGMRRPWATPVRFWRHGIIEPEILRYPKQIALWGMPEERHLVATPLQRDFLERHGYGACCVVGMPYLYARAEPVERIAGSLLIMPTHSTKHSPHPDDEKIYLESLRPLLDRFSFVAGCIHRQCAEKGLWTQTFEEAGIAWFEGAAIDDANGLDRMRTLLRSFEFVSANSFTSGLVYAALEGCKVSLFGPYCPPRRDQLKDEPFCKSNPDIFELILEEYSEAAVRRRMPWLFVDPHRAECPRAWAWEIAGGAYQMQADGIREALGWTAAGQIRNAGKAVWAKMKRFQRL